LGIPGIDEEIDGAMQQAAQPGRHCILPWEFTSGGADSVFKRLPFKVGGKR
jgi:hypothetical protein